MIDGKPHPHVLGRTPEAGSPVSNASRGGVMDFPPTPPELVAAAEYYARKLPIPFFCVDFLHDGERFWFSELEPDGVIAPEFDDPDRSLQRDMIRARFTAYRKGHQRWLASGGTLSFNPANLGNPANLRNPANLGPVT